MNELTMEDFLRSCSSPFLSSKLQIISNSVDVKSSLKNAELSARYGNIISFAGIHPQHLQDPNFATGSLESSLEQIKEVSKCSDGIGEIGMDPKYGNIELQRTLFEKQIGLSESSNLPVSIHTRNTTRQMLDALSSYGTGGKVMFHWFSGTIQELKEANDSGYYTSFGPSILYSKRMRELVRATNPELLLAETDSPLRLVSLLGDQLVTPSIVASVLFRMALIMEVSFDETIRINYENCMRYLGRKTD